MRIRPWVITGTAGTAAIAALGVIVTQNDPATSTLSVIALFWVALGLALWSIFATVLLAVRAGIPRAIGISALWTIAGLGLVNMARMGNFSIGLLIGILSATLALSALMWWRIRHGGHS